MAKRVYVDIDKIEFRHSETANQVIMILYKDGHVIEKLIVSQEKYPSFLNHVSNYLFFGTFDDYRKATDEFSVSEDDS
jgi:hypothetical protein